MADELEYDAPSPEDFLDDPMEKPAPRQSKSQRQAVQQFEEEDEVEPEATPRQRTQARAAPAQPVKQAPAPQAVPQQTAQSPNQDVIVPYEIPKKIGFYNRALNKAIIEDDDMLKVIMAAQAEILNRLERIEAALA